ncbi:hypothetical protein OV203_41225 [Nannocystis sp. ILAH1]|uniref:hypothetical protein n=1 Tax=Nannocystis sp. ILAH1 TaxID=2996789 RepID=UPI00227184D5|nr:hypothetical protein [Nannocystis sp. ILAH1]MCY0989722.1 hypothetical protein [Nannocystis sp. ILAH1]MCY0993633.1 hypothetical protein [Nannocystis sp. ILAH1]
MAGIRNQPAERGAYTLALLHAYDARAHLRPDLRLVFEDDRRKFELLLDAKLSSDLGYLRAAYLKMHGYLADRPHAFGNDVHPKAIILAERRLARPPRPTDPVVYLDPTSCRESGALDTLIIHWLAQLLSPAP